MNLERFWILIIQRLKRGSQTYFDELPVGVPIDVVIFNGTKNFCYEFLGWDMANIGRLLMAMIVKLCTFLTIENFVV